MRILLVGPDGASPIARLVPSLVEVPAAEPLRFRIEADAAHGELQVALRLPSRAWERRVVAITGKQRIDGHQGIDFFATGLTPGDHRAQFEATLETHGGGLVRQLSVAGDVLLRAR